MTNPQYYKGVIDATGCISNAWNLIKPNYGLYLGISLLTLVAISCIPCVNVFLMGPMMGGVYYVALRAMRGEPVEFGMMFKGFEKFVPLMVIGIIQSIPGIIYQVLNFSFRLSDIGLRAIQGGSGSRDIDFYQAGEPEILLAGGLLVVVIVVSIVLMLFSIAWAITFTFAIPLAMEHNIGPIEAIKLSARASWGNVGGIIVLAILGGLLGFAGALALCIGFLFVVPIIWVAWAFAYRQVFPDLLPPVYRTEPPPPDAYGAGSFGRGM